MLFNSLDFLLFFAVITFAYYKLPHKYRWLLLLVGSCYFYMSFIPIYILVLGFTIILDYWAGIYIEKSNNRNKKIFLIISLVANIGVLCVFKYYNFFIDNIYNLVELSNKSASLPHLSIILPIGLSFHTFQAMSYSIEVYKGNQKAEKHFGIYALYVMFYPQLVAGPIERPQNILPQLKNEIKYQSENISNGVQIMLWGLFKKVVVADRLAILIDNAYANPAHHNGFTLLIASFFFSIQIYCDFSGYSDMAIGCAKTLGIDLMKNFNKPYFSRSISDFWRRWHISLSTWFRDYVYIPLGGSRNGYWLTYRNIIIVFLISGLWHGASWTFIAWGFIHGILLIIEHLFKLNKVLNSSNRLLSFLQIVIVFLIVSFAWIFFRAESVSDAFLIYKKIFTNLQFNTSSIKECILLFKGDATSLDSFIICIFFIIILFLYEGKTNITKKLSFSENEKSNYTLLAFVVLSILFFGYFNSRSFIYFQF